MFTPLVQAATFALIGLLLGPLVGIVVDRAVERVRPQPEHRCPRCQHGLGPRSLVPVLSWFQGCRRCGSGPTLRYPVIDVLTALTFAALGFRFADSWLLAPYLGFGLVMVALTVIDAETHLLPNVIVWPSIWVSLFMILALSGFNNYQEGITGALVGGALAGGFLGAANLIYEPGMGRGDVKLALLLGLFVGWVNPAIVDALRATLWTIVGALLLVGVGGLAYNLARRRSVRAEIPFGPALIVVAVIMIVAAPVSETGL